MIPAKYFDKYPKEARQRFGTASSAIFQHEMIHNGGWYNQLGERVGWGDMTADSMYLMARALQGDDIILVLTESDKCGWEWSGLNPGIKFDIDNPGEQYVWEHARYVLASGAVYYISSVVRDGLGLNEVRRRLGLKEMPWQERQW